MNWSIRTLDTGAISVEHPTHGVCVLPARNRLVSQEMLLAAVRELIQVRGLVDDIHLLLLTGPD